MVTLNSCIWSKVNYFCYVMLLIPVFSFLPEQEEGVYKKKGGCFQSWPQCLAGPAPQSLFGTRRSAASARPQRLAGAGGGSAKLAKVSVFFSTLFQAKSPDTKPLSSDEFRIFAPQPKLSSIEVLEMKRSVSFSMISIPLPADKRRKV